MGSWTFLRHGALPKPYQGRYNGWQDIPLDPQSIDIQKLDGLRAREFDALYSSDLQRATQTLEMLFGKGHLVTVTDALREVRFRDEIEGKSFQEIEQLASFDPAHLASQATWHAYLCDEPQAVFEARLKGFLDGLPREGDLLICSHSGAIGTMLRLLERPLSGSLGYLDTVTLSV